MVTTIHDHNWKNAGEFLLAVVQAGNPRAQGIDGRLRPAAAAPGIRETINSEGGFLIPPTFADRIWERIYNTGEILRRCTDYGAPVGNSHFLPYFNETSRADGSRFGGCRSYWMTEAGALTDSQPDFGVQKRELKKLAGLVYVTEEMVSDAPRLAENLERMAALELQFQFEEAIVNGTGAGRPQGLLNANCKLTVSKETNQPAATIQGSNVQKMLARLWGPSWRSAVWLFNQELADVLPTLVVESGYGSGTTAVESALWDWGGNAYSGGWPTLAGRPAIPVEHCQAPGTEGDLVLCDLSQYAVVAKAKNDLSMDVRFLYYEGAFRFVLRCDGAPLWQSALTPAHGTDTLSPIVTLAARA